jgi:outer membrane protein assembly factor BamB
MAAIVPAVAALAAAATLSTWLRSDKPPEVEKRDSEIVYGTAVGKRTSAKDGTLTKGNGTPADIPGSWPGFRGADRRNILADNARLARSWTEGGPPVLWEVDLGEGYAGPAIIHGRVYILDYDQEKLADAYRCLSMDDGREIWRYSYPVAIKRQHGMSRAVCAATDQVVVGMGPLCHLTGLDAESGRLLWTIDLVQQFETKIPQWYAGQCPLIDDGRVIAAPGGTALMLAIEVTSGEVVWETPNPRKWDMTHSSIMPVDVAGQRMYVYCASGGIVGVSAKDGKELWNFPKWRVPTANVPTPVPVGDGRICFTGGYRAGSLMLQVRKTDEGFAAEELFRLKSKVFDSEQQTPIFHDGHLYGVRSNGELVCLDLKGQPLWTSGRDHRFGLGAYMLANGLLYVLDDKGTLSLIEAKPDDYRLLARAQVLEGHESWGPMAMVQGRLLVRDLTRMVCLDVREP